MAEFGPKVFHALARFGDKDNLHRNFKTEKKIYRLGLNEYSQRPGSGDIVKTRDAMEQLKNAFWKLIMLKARDEFLQGKIIIDENGHKKVSFKIEYTFGEDMVHPKKHELKDEIYLYWMGTVSTGESEEEYSQDTKDVSKNIRKLAAACGPDNFFDEIFGNEDLYKKMFPKGQPQETEG